MPKRLLSLVLTLILTLSLFGGFAAEAEVTASSSLTLADIPEDAVVVIRYPFEGPVNLVRNRIAAMEGAAAWTEDMQLTLANGKNYTATFGSDESGHFALSVDLSDWGSYGLKIVDQTAYLQAFGLVYSLDISEISTLLSKLLNFELPKTEIVADTTIQVPTLLLTFLLKEAGISFTNSAKTLSLDVSLSANTLASRALDFAMLWMKHYNDESTDNIIKILETASQTIKGGYFGNWTLDFHFTLDKTSEGKNWMLSCGANGFSLYVDCTDGIIDGKVVLPNDSNDYVIQGKVIGDGLQATLGISGDEAGRRSNQILANLSLSWGDNKHISVQIADTGKLYALSYQDIDQCLEIKATIQSVDVLDARISYTWDEQTRELVITPDIAVIKDYWTWYDEELSEQSGDLFRLTESFAELCPGSYNGAYRLNVMESADQKWIGELTFFNTYYYSNSVSPENQSYRLQIDAPTDTGCALRLYHITRKLNEAKAGLISTEEQIFTFSESVSKAPFRGIDTTVAIPLSVALISSLISSIFQ